MNGSFTPPAVAFSGEYVNSKTMGTDAGLLAKFGHMMRQVVGPLGRGAVGPLGRWGTQAEQTVFLRVR